MTHAIVAAGIILAFVAKVLADRTLASSQAVEDRVGRPEVPADAVSIEIERLDAARYRRFKAGLRAAVDLDVTLVLRVPEGVEVPRAWTALASRSRVLVVRTEDRDSALASTGSCISTGRST